MSLTAAIAMALTVKEELTSVPNVSATANKRDITVDGLNLSVAITPATVLATIDKALSAGAGQLDFRAIPGVNLSNQDANGLKLQAAFLSNPDTNANPITITTGSSNGYDFGSLTLAPGERALLHFPETRADVDATHKLLDLAGTGTQTLKGVLVFG